MRTKRSLLVAWFFAVFVIFGKGTGALPALAAQDVREVKVTASEFFFDPDKNKTASGKVAFVVTNAGEFPHAFAIEGIEVKSTIPRIDPGETAKITVDLLKGAYVFYCPLEGHREQGMVGNFVVGVSAKPAAKKRPAAPLGSSGY